MHENHAKRSLESSQKETQVFLAEHNLYLCLSELNRITQAIKDGRLWEPLDMRDPGHPTLLQDLKKLRKYEDFIEVHSPAVKKSGLFFFDSVGLLKPEVVRHRKKIMERYSPPNETNILLLVP